MDEKHKKAASLLKLKLRCEEYITNITSDYCDYSGPIFNFMHVTGNARLKRNLLVCPVLLQSLENRNIDINDFMRHMARPSLHKMIQHWLTTLPAYHNDAEYPAGEIQNIFCWSEFSGTYGYIINLDEAYVWKIEGAMVEDMTTYCKLANRFFECLEGEHGEICKGYLRFKPVDWCELPKKCTTAHLDSVQMPAMISSAKTSGEVLLNIAEHLVSKSIYERQDTIPDLVYNSRLEKSQNVMMRPKLHQL